MPTLLRNLPPIVIDKMSQDFAMFSALLDGSTRIFICGDASSPQSVMGYAAVSQNAEYLLLEAIEVLPHYQGLGLSKRLLERVFSYVCDSDSLLMVQELSRSGKRCLVGTMELLAHKYGVYVMQECEYEAIKA